MRAYDFITEIFNRPWELITNTPFTDNIKSMILKNGDGKDGLHVYQVKDDSHNIFITINYKNAWEVHHSYYDGTNFISGKRLKLDNDINTNFIATAIKLYKELLDSGHDIRVATVDNKDDLWSSYSQFIKYILKKHGDDYYASDVVNDISIQGLPQISQTIRKYNKKWIEESLNLNRAMLESLYYTHLKEQIISKYNNDNINDFITVAEDYTYVKKYIDWVAREYFNSDNIDFNIINESLYNYEWLKHKDNFPRRAGNIKNISAHDLTALLKNFEGL